MSYTDKTLQAAAWINLNPRKKNWSVEKQLWALNIANTLNSDEKRRYSQITSYIKNISGGI